MRKLWIPLALVSVVLITIGCSEPANNAGQGDGLAGPDEALIPALTDVFTVGAFEGEDWEVFGRVASVSFDGSGNVFIMDSGASRLTVVGPDGSYVRTIGKAGGGPGEFQAPFGVAVFPAGNVAVFDLGKRGFQLFDPSGAYTASVPVDMSTGAPGMLMIPLPDGRVVSAGGFRMSFDGPPGDSGTEEEAPGRPVDRFSLEDGSHEVWYRAWEVPPVPEGEARTLEGEGGNIAFTMGMRAFEPEVHFGAFSDGDVAVVDSTGYRVKVIGDDGSVVSVLERPIEPVVLTEALREAERERRLAALEDRAGGRVVMIGGTGGGMQIDQDQMREMMEGQIREMEFAEVVPVISALMVDREDRLWVRRFGEDGAEAGATDVITRDGRYVGTVSPDAFAFPDAFGPDGLVAYIETDDLGVQTVRIARLGPIQ